MVWFSGFYRRKHTHPNIHTKTQQKETKALWVELRSKTKQQQADNKRKEKERDQLAVKGNKKHRAQYTCFI